MITQEEIDGVRVWVSDLSVKLSEAIAAARRIERELKLKKSRPVFVRLLARIRDSSQLVEEFEAELMKRLLSMATRGMRHTQISRESRRRRRANFNGRVLRCAECKHQTWVPRALAGQTTECPKCGHQWTIREQRGIGARRQRESEHRPYDVNESTT